MMCDMRLYVCFWFDHDSIVWFFEYLWLTWLLEAKERTHATILIRFKVKVLPQLMIDT